jgi:hypothetical protein
MLGIRINQTGERQNIPAQVYWFGNFGTMKPSKHCLVVDHSDVIRKVARAFLERLGYSVPRPRRARKRWRMRN